LYLVGRLLGVAPESSFLETQVAAMAEAAESAGLEPQGFDELLQEVADRPEQAFESLRELLFDATTSLVACREAEAALEVLSGLEDHRFAALLHRYELSNWVLYARAYGSPEAAPQVRAVDRALREARDPLAWLTSEWIHPAKGVPTSAPAGTR
jgi:hypothetical protein